MTVFHLNADMMHDALRADVNAAMRVTSADSTATGAVLATTRANGRQFDANLNALQSLKLPTELSRDFEESRRGARAYIAAANKLVAIAVRDHEQALPLEDEFNAAFDELLALNERVTTALAERIQDAERDALQSEAAAKLWILITSIVTALIAWGFVAVIAISVRRSLRQVSDAARPGRRQSFGAQRDRKPGRGGRARRRSEQDGR